jgi:hypothetical protein
MIIAALPAYANGRFFPWITQPLATAAMSTDDTTRRVRSIMARSPV